MNLNWQCAQTYSNYCKNMQFHECQPLSHDLLPPDKIFKKKRKMIYAEKVIKLLFFGKIKGTF